MIVEDWGQLDYRESWKKQLEYRDNLITNDEAEERIVFVEHPAVYTLGFHGNQDNLKVSEEYLRQINAECIRIERGGDITYHGPGQLVVYPIINLRKHNLGVKQYIELLEKSVIDTLAEFNIASSCNNDAIGVWIDWGKPIARKICAIGVKIRHGISMHGLALNVNTDLSAFSRINPCGFTDKGVTSMQEELGKRIEMSEIKIELSNKLLHSLLH